MRVLIIIMIIKMFTIPASEHFLCPSLQANGCDTSEMRPVMSDAVLPDTSCKEQSVPLKEEC